MDEKIFRQTSEKEWYYGKVSYDGRQQDGIGLKRERDDSLYYGFWKQGLRTGLGVLCEPDGGLTAGTWENDKPSDIMLKVYPPNSDLAIFCGELANGKPTEGTLFCADMKKRKQLYHGIFSDWRKEDFDGEGVFLWPDKRIYAGRWKNGGPDIGGVIRKQDGNMIGTLCNVQKGYVVKSWQEKTEKQLFYGMTEDAEARNANGIWFYADGEFFAGVMKGGQRTGFGLCRDPNENIYIGEWDSGGLQRWGMCICRNAGRIDLYAGEFQNSQYDGEGCALCRTPDGWDFIYNGIWKDGKKSGTGILNLNEGGMYIGGFANDQRDGAGEIVNPDGSRSAIHFRMGKPDVRLEQVNGPGPVRRQYGKGDTVPGAVFNSLRDGEEFGEEQCFVGIREEAGNAYQRLMRISPGCDYEVRIFYHNNADIKNAGEEGTARESRLRVFFTKQIRPGETGVVSAVISSESNILPVIWDSVALQSAEEMSLSYKIASARIYNGRKRDGLILPQSLFSEKGVYLGMDELNGILPPGSSGYVSFIIHTSGKRRENSPSFSRKAVPGANSMMQKPAPDEARNSAHLNEKVIKKRRSRISIDITAAAGDSKYEKNVSADIGEELRVKIAFTNSANSQDIIISVMLPPAVELVLGSTFLELSDGSRRRQPDSWVGEGLVLSDFFAEGEGEMQFRLRYFPDDTSSSDDMRVKAMIETADITMCKELRIMGTY